MNAFLVIRWALWMLSVQWTVCSLGADQKPELSNYGPALEDKDVEPLVTAPLLNVSAEAVNSSAIRVSWSPPQGVVKHYQLHLYYGIHGEAAEVERNMIIEPSGNTFIIGDLPNATDVYVRLRSLGTKDDMVSGELWSSPVSTMTSPVGMTVPIIEVTDISSNSLTVVVGNVTKRGRIFVRLTDKQGATTPVSHGYDPSVRRIFLKNLKADTNYSIATVLCFSFANVDWNRLQQYLSHPIFIQTLPEAVPITRSSTEHPTTTTSSTQTTHRHTETGRATHSKDTEISSFNTAPPGTAETVAATSSPSTVTDTVAATSRPGPSETTENQGPTTSVRSADLLDAEISSSTTAPPGAAETLAATSSPSTVTNTVAATSRPGPSETTENQGPTTSVRSTDLPEAGISSSTTAPPGAAETLAATSSPSNVTDTVAATFRPSPSETTETLGPSTNVTPTDLPDAGIPSSTAAPPGTAETVAATSSPISVTTTVTATSRPSPSDTVKTQGPTTNVRSTDLPDAGIPSSTAAPPGTAETVAAKSSPSTVTDTVAATSRPTFSETAGPQGTTNSLRSTELQDTDGLKQAEPPMTVGTVPAPVSLTPAVTGNVASSSNIVTTASSSVTRGPNFAFSCLLPPLLVIMFYR